MPKFFYNVKILVPLSGEEVAIAYLCAKEHYDFCSISSDERKSAFLLSMIGQLRFSNEDKGGKDLRYIKTEKLVLIPEFHALEMTFDLDDEIDYMRKMLEQPAPALKIFSREKIEDFLAKLSKAFREQQEEWSRINEEYIREKENAKSGR